MILISSNKLVAEADIYLLKEEELSNQYFTIKLLRVEDIINKTQISLIYEKNILSNIDLGDLLSKQEKILREKNIDYFLISTRTNNTNHVILYPLKQVSENISINRLVEIRRIGVFCKETPGGASNIGSEKIYRAEEIIWINLDNDKNKYYLFNRDFSLKNNCSMLILVTSEGTIILRSPQRTVSSEEKEKPKKKKKKEKKRAKKRKSSKRSKK